MAFRANNGRYVITKRSGHLYATSDTADDNCKYFFYLVNRPILVLKCEQGFVGYKSASSPKLECNKATYETIQVERGAKGMVHFKGELIKGVFDQFRKLPEKTRSVDHAGIPTPLFRFLIFNCCGRCYDSCYVLRSERQILAR